MDKTGRSLCRQHKFAGGKGGEEGQSRGIWRGSQSDLRRDRRSNGFSVIKTEIWYFAGTWKIPERFGNKRYLCPGELKSRRTGLLIRERHARAALQVAARDINFFLLSLLSPLSLSEIPGKNSAYRVQIIFLTFNNAQRESIAAKVPAVSYNFGPHRIMTGIVSYTSVCKNA